MTLAPGDSFPIVDSAGWVMKRSSRVFFHPERIDSAIRKWGFMIEEDPGWQHPCHYFDGTAESIRWIFVLDTLNHCFWPERGEAPWTVYYSGNGYSGYWGLAAALKRAVEKGIPVTRADYLACIEKAELMEIFRGDGKIPLLDQRLQNLREAGNKIASLWEGDIVHLLESSGGSALRAVRNLVDSFPSYRDEAVYKGEKVCFWKRAQLFVADVHAAFSGVGPGKFTDIDGLTVFADYKLPQVLRELGIISYHSTLAGRIDDFQPLKPGSEEEVEIRAAAIWAAEALRAGCRCTGMAVNSVRIDNWLWRLGQLDEFRTRPYHRCRTIFY